MFSSCRLHSWHGCAIPTEPLGTLSEAPPMGGMEPRPAREQPIRLLLQCRPFSFEVLGPFAAAWFAVITAQKTQRYGWVFLRPTGAD